MNYKNKTWERFYNFEILFYWILAIIGSVFKIFPLELIALFLVFLRTFSYFFFHRELIQLINAGLFGILVLLFILGHFSVIIHLLYSALFFIFIIWYLILSDRIATKYNLHRKI